MKPTGDTYTYNWRERLQTEHDELADRLDKLDKFITRGGDSSLSENDMNLLRIQRNVMHAYWTILRIRLAL